RVGDQLLEREATQAPQRLHGVTAGVLVEALDEPAERELDPAQHGDEQVALVPEVPVDRAPTVPGAARDRLEGGAREAVLEEGLLGGVEQQLARRLRLHLGSPGHPLPPGYSPPPAPTVAWTGPL